MQNTCIIVLTLILTGHFKYVFGSLFLNDNHVQNRYKYHRDDLAKAKELLQSLNDDSSDNLSEFAKSETTNTNVRSSNDYDSTENKLESKISNDGTYNDDAIRLLWNVYVDYVNEKSDSKSRRENTDRHSPKYEKRALTMLTRWKPFRLNQLNTLNGGNGRHVIRSPFTSRSDPNSYKQIMGRPFRWG